MFIIKIPALDVIVAISFCKKKKKGLTLLYQIQYYVTANIHTTAHT